MKTNIDIDDKLVKEAMKVLQVKTKKEAVEAGLKAVLARQSKLNMANMRGVGWGWEDEKPSTPRKKLLKSKKKATVAKQKTNS